MRLNVRSLIGIIGLGTVIFFSSHHTAFAYIEPVSTSMILQLLAGAAIGIGVWAKVYWRKISSFFRQDSKRDGTPDKPADKINE